MSSEMADDEEESRSGLDLTGGEETDWLGDEDGTDDDEVQTDEADE